jgi:hypothetical protein
MNTPVISQQALLTQLVQVSLCSHGNHLFTDGYSKYQTTVAYTLHTLIRIDQRQID